MYAACNAMGYATGNGSVVIITWAQEPNDRRIDVYNLGPRPGEGDDEKASGDQKVLDLAEKALAEGSPCAALFDKTVMGGKTALEFFKDMKSKISFVDVLKNKKDKVILGQASGTNPTGPSTHTRVTKIAGTNTIIGEEIIRTPAMPGTVTYIKIGRSAGLKNIIMSLGMTGINTNSKVETLIHELGHAADLIYGDKASEIISDTFDDDDMTDEAQDTNRDTTEKCLKYIKSLK